MRCSIRTIGLLTAASMMLGAGSVWAQDTTIAGSLHDLGSGGNEGLPALVTPDTDEVCVFCHTPHSANTGNDGPLWNKLSAAGPFTLYDSATLDSPAPLTVGSVSAACLSCHDGTLGVDVVINAPGSGGINLAGSKAWTGGPDPATIDLVGLGAAALGSDLSNDHPIGIQYAGGIDGAGNPVGDPDFAVASTLNGQWWVETGANGVRNKSDMILYTRADGIGGQVYVECASCHDPHSGAANDNVAGSGNAEGSAVSFMRIQNTGSNVCLACHVK